MDESGNFGVGFNPLRYPISTRIPAHYHVAMAGVAHVPFAMTLIDIIRPRFVVELGTLLSVSYFAFCQAVKELGLSTECYAIGMLRKELPAEDVFEDLKAIHDERYSLFSKLVRSSFDDAAQQFDESTIDLLHIDNCYAYDAVKHEFESWLPKISDRGVVLFNNIDMSRNSSGPPQFWGEVKQRYSCFEFFHSYGLGVLAVGEHIPNGLRALIDMSPTEQVLVRQYFANLGLYLTELHGIAMQRANLYELLDVKTQECKGLEEVRAATEEVRAATMIELAALRMRLGRLRYRIVDKAAQVLGRVPLLPGVLRSTMGAIIRLIRERG
jgi:hypothetical protein